MKYEVHVKLHRNHLEVKDNIISIGISVCPEKGKANAEIIRKIAKYFKVPQSSVKIITGFTSKKKLIEVEF
ncbi:MAG: DUF167 domain-containing protein [Verrucomicrobia bacterium]|nr:DUF167 domain-containing protein [Verrucomicrobiota bacterium]